jgi:hypothetical protein
MSRFLRYTVLTLLLSYSLLTEAQLRINELMTNNVSFNMDDAFDYSMWVELYNPSTVTSYPLREVWFSDDKTQAAKWKPVFDSIIAPKSYVLLYFERFETYGHASFKLDPDGGTLYLFDNALNLLDSVTYPRQFRNASWGRQTDGASIWKCFAQPSPGSTNNGKETGSVQCTKPVVNIQGGYFTSPQNVLYRCDPGDTVFYTTTNAEPTRSSSRFLPNTPLTVSSTVVLRARAFCKGKVPSEITTQSYLMNTRDFNLPVVSISTTQANLTDPKTGIYCDGDGTNGLIGNGQSVKRNYNQDWNRPVNFELYDTTGVQRLNQEVDIKILGCWTRAYAQKSISISPKKKFGDNQLRYDLFAATKPNRKYRDIQLRNSGNDFFYSMLRDGFMQSIVMKRLTGLDYMAYEPAVLYMNGQYWGIQNLRERSNEDWVFSNYGLDESDVLALEATIDIDTDKDIATDTAFIAFSNFLKNNDVSKPEVYEQVCRKMDVDNFMAYMMAEIYTANTDWPHNNVKMWRKKNDGPWHWILSDTDFGMNLYNSLEANNTLSICLGESGGKPDWSTVVLRRLVLNETFRNTFVDRYAIHLSTTFKTERVNNILDSVARKIMTEINYHKARFSSARTLTSDIGIMKTFSAARPANLLNYLSARFCNAAPIRSLELSSNIDGSSYTLNGQVVPDKTAAIQYFQNKTISVEARPVKGYAFDHWEKTRLVGTLTLVPKGSTWRYYDGSAMPATNWYTAFYPDAGWAQGKAQLGYGGKGEVTTIGYGGVASAKYATSYYRYRAQITNLSAKSNFQITLLVDDGAAVYVNGTEVGRANLPAGTLAYGTYATTFNDGITANFSVPASLLKEGENILAVEVHQCNATSSDVIFDLSMTCEAALVAETVVVPDKVLFDTLQNSMSLKAIYKASTTPEPTVSMFINEVVSSNNQIEDEFGEKDDYLELYNAGTIDVDIAGWFLSDVSGNQTLATIPPVADGKTIVPAKGWICFWADNTPAQGPLHLPFKLSRDGETLLLSRWNTANQLVLVDSVSFPLLNPNLSYARVTDASPFWIVQAPTFLCTNQLGNPVKRPQDNDSAPVWPTLFTDGFTVHSTIGSIIEVFDLNGRTLCRMVSETEDVRIDAGTYRPGVYVVRIGNQSFKILKRR